MAIPGSPLRYPTDLSSNSPGLFRETRGAGIDRPFRAGKKKKVQDYLPYQVYVNFDVSVIGLEQVILPVRCAYS